MSDSRFAAFEAISAEIDRLDRADLLILQYPMWWHLPPAMLKGWFDRVLVYGDVYTSKQRFENGRFAGKRAMLSLTVGTSAETYAFDGRSGDIELLLWRVNFTLAYVGFSVLRPFVAYGVEAGLRYSEASVVESRLQRLEQGLARTLQGHDRIETVPFNRMADWGSDGRAKPHAPTLPSTSPMASSCARCMRSRVHSRTSRSVSRLIGGGRCRRVPVWAI